MFVAQSAYRIRPEIHPGVSDLHLRRLGLGESEFEGQISRREIDRQKSVSSMISSSDLQRLHGQMGLVDARHIIPAKWFTHSFNRAWSRGMEQRWSLVALGSALLLSPPAQSDAVAVKQALLDLSRRAINQELNIFIGSRKLNQLNGRLIGRMRKLLFAHDRIVEEFRCWHPTMARYQALASANPPRHLVKEYEVSVEQLARRIERILFNPRASGATALGYGKAKVSQSTGVEIEHLRPAIEAILDAVYNLGKAIEPPTEAVSKILDLAIGIVDSVCVDPSQIGQRGPFRGDENLRLFRAMQNELLLPRGARLITSSTRFCNAVDAKDQPAAGQAAQAYCQALSDLADVSAIMRTLWDIPEDPRLLGPILAGLESPRARVDHDQIEKMRGEIRKQEAAARTSVEPPGPESHLRLKPDSALGLCHRSRTPDWIKDVRHYLNKAAHGESLFDPWLGGVTSAR